MGTWEFGYDELNRLTSAHSTKGSLQGKSLSWTYDAFGNRTSQTYSDGSGSSNTTTAVYTVDGTTTGADNGKNQMTSAISTAATGANSNSSTSPMLYDSAGNTAFDNLQYAGHRYFYDGDGRLCALALASANNGTIYTGGSTLTQYIYDASGNRVGKGTNTDLTAGCDTTGPGFTLSATYVIGPSGEQMTELDGGGNWKHTNVYAAGMLLATYDGAGLHYHLSDGVGTRRAQTNAAGALEQQYVSLPYGDGLTPASATNDPTEQHFTGQEMDAESGLHYMHARHYNSTLGRFIQPDPSGMAFTHLNNPQSFNLYSYAQNNPLANVDPTGLDCAYLNDAGDGLESFDQNSSSQECGSSGGYWVDGGLTSITINADKGTVELTGTNDGTDSTYAGYQDTIAFVDMWSNTQNNPFGHMTLGLGDQTSFGQNPASDMDFMATSVILGVHSSVQGQIMPEQVDGTLLAVAAIPITGMQAQMIQNSINQAQANPPLYSLDPSLGLDCSTWVQQVLGNAGVITGPQQIQPIFAMQQLGANYPLFRPTP
jgi:RHS repeat-associated protein